MSNSFALVYLWGSDVVWGAILLHASCFWVLLLGVVCYLSFVLRRMHQKLYTPQIDLEVSVLSGDQLMYQSMKCEPPETPPEKMAPPSASSPTASAGLLISSYKVPEATNNWKAEVKRIWNKPVEQLPIGIDLPRLANSIFVPSIPPVELPIATVPKAAEPTEQEKEAKAEPKETNGEPKEANGESKEAIGAEQPATTTPVGEATSSEAPAPLPADEIDTRAREIMQTLFNMGRFVEGDEYAQNLVDNFGNFVILEGAKDRDMSREIARLVSEYLGKESRMVKVLKACNQAIIAPAVIELTLNVCAKVPFKDAGGWRMELSKNEDNLITVTHIKQQRSRSSNKEEEFSFEWHLEIIFDEGLTGLSDVFLSIPKLNFGPAVSQTTMEGIQYTFAPYLVRR
jgi:hypothetical protein